ncbi:hypothetical protein [Terriglobus aquaticus]|uniref:Uncharacterized protein n=1 Tax=Terriglobus aquaticus TaxID=940139 RepID=A0ABW9KIH7_9BACT|nr:hypothetical protein [Terriglobus aquaticus]
MTTFQDAKDSFYLLLRNGLATLNPDRTIVVRGATRPAVLVAENELPSGSAEQPLNAFVLHWGAVAVDGSEAMPLESARCTIQVQTSGSPEVAGMDRGRTMAAMRAELQSLLAAGSAAKASYAGASATAAATPVFWSGVVAEDLKETADTLNAAYSVDVFAWREP